MRVKAGAVVHDVRKQLLSIDLHTVRAEEAVAWDQIPPADRWYGECRCPISASGVAGVACVRVSGRLGHPRHPVPRCGEPFRRSAAVRTWPTTPCPAQGWGTPGTAS